MTPPHIEFYTLAFSTDDETLQDSFDDPAAATDWLRRALAEPLPTDPGDARQHHTRIGTAARMLRRLDIAEQHLASALLLASEHGRDEEAVFARIRLAHVLQWQGRFDEAIVEFDRCIEESGRIGSLSSRKYFAFQHAGKCHYDAGNWEVARGHFAMALRLRLASDADPELIASSSQALNAADACFTGRLAAQELDRLVPAAHARLSDLPARAELLVDLRGPLADGVVPMALVRAVHRYVPKLDAALETLVGDGWLLRRGDGVAMTPRSRELLAEVSERLDAAATELWGEPEELLAMAQLVVERATGTSAGVVFDALAARPPVGSVAGRLLDRLSALRYHRADAHAAAWQAEGLTADGVRALRDSDPVRRRIEAATGRVAARPYRRIEPEQRARLIAALHTLPS
ncbi:hypothetical protein [Allokutzneria oryzae]|uniref:Tetratricopeptide repeat protein n=1 Tax=Allokutzneria oryzae TaxID=1378989 RepID=A0ABV5ZZD5_9PSEU